MFIIGLPILKIMCLFDFLSFSGNYGVLFASTRNASKKSGGSSRNAKGRARGKSRGIKREDGDWVTQGTILVRQLGLDFLPGLNVSLVISNYTKD